MGSAPQVRGLVLLEPAKTGGVHMAGTGVPSPNSGLRSITASSSALPRGFFGARASDPHQGWPAEP